MSACLQPQRTEREAKKNSRDYQIREMENVITTIVLDLYATVAAGQLLHCTCYFAELLPVGSNTDVSV